MSRHTPRRKRVDRAFARGRRQRAHGFLEAARAIAATDHADANACVSNAVLAGIAAGDAICAAALGEISVSQHHGDAADLLASVDRDLGRRLTTLVGLKSQSQYGASLIGAANLRIALRCAEALVAAATERV